MEFWTIMIITYGGAVFGDETSVIPYPSPRACGDAIEAVYATLAEPFPELMIQCRETAEVSRMVYPKPRPADLFEDAE